MKDIGSPSRNFKLNLTSTLLPDSKKHSKVLRFRAKRFVWLGKIKTLIVRMAYAAMVLNLVVWSYLLSVTGAVLTWACLPVIVLVSIIFRVELNCGLKFGFWEVSYRSPKKAKTPFSL